MGRTVVFWEMRPAGDPAVEGGALGTQENAGVQGTWRVEASVLREVGVENSLLFHWP
jgi:hypothetical protein